MNILDEILNWSRSLRPWQQDALARLYSQSQLTENDLRDLVALVKAEHGIPDPQGRQSIVPDPSLVPVGASSGRRVVLHSMRSVSNVNALAADQQLDFAESGITIVYGDNGTGKSGYSRVLKRACRARDQKEAILPNVSLTEPSGEPPRAVFDVTIDGNRLDLMWTDGQDVAEELSSIVVFDERCARAYLDDEGDFTYVLHGLDILEELARVCQALKERVDDERSSALVDVTAFADLKGDTAVGKFIGTLSGSSDVIACRSLADLNDAELQRLAEVSRALSDHDPLDKARRLRLEAGRLRRLYVTTSGLMALLSESTVLRLSELHGALQSAQQAVDLAHREFSSGAEQLPGTGGSAWKTMFAAARDYSRIAYPEVEFPVTSGGSRCLLCQQELRDGASRLQTFEAFIQREVHARQQAALQGYRVASETFSHSVVSLGVSPEDLAEIETRDPQLKCSLLEFEAVSTHRHASVCSAISTGDWTTVRPLPDDPTDDIRSLASRLESEAETLERATDLESRVALQTELSEFEARTKLKLRLREIETAIRLLDLQRRLSECSASLNTRGITAKATELAKAVLSENLDVALNREFEELGVEQLRVAFEPQPSRGRLLHKLVLKAAVSSMPSAVMSEGEQRAIAIATFMAEVTLSGGSCGLIFDDPVSSLDHHRRERVASRLAREGLQRQVIVFSHDLYFVFLLLECAERHGVQVLEQSLTRGPEGFGVPLQGLPLAGMTTSSRIRNLNSRLQTIESLRRRNEVDLYRRETVDAYRELRLAWERATEEVLFGDSVVRFRKSIETNRLKGVSVEDDDYRAITRGMTKCSNFAHDGAALGASLIPEPAELKADIEELEAWRVKVVSRSEANRRRRG